MHVLVMGGAGQLGRMLRSVFGEEPGVTVTSWDLPDYDMTRPSISHYIAGTEPDLVINAGAWTDVDGAEANPELAYAANALGPKLVADGCRMRGVPMVQFSTNEVFWGEDGATFHEYDAPNPRASMHEARRPVSAVQSTVAEHDIVRIAWLYGPGENHLPSKIVVAADRHGSLQVVDDEFGNPTYTVDAARAMCQLVDTRRYGVYHLVNEGQANRMELAKAVLAGLRSRRCARVAYQDGGLGAGLHRRRPTRCSSIRRWPPRYPPACTGRRSGRLPGA